MHRAKLGGWLIPKFRCTGTQYFREKIQEKVTHEQIKWIKILESENRIFLKIQDKNSASIMNVMGKVTPYVPVLP